MAFKVTPWEVEGDIDYEKLIKDFGVSPFRKMPEEMKDILLFRRGIVYAQRDFSRIAKAIKKGDDFAMMTGLMPSGSFHFGHKVVADQIIAFQELGASVYIAVADIEAYNSRNQTMEELRRTAIEQYLTNYIALGLDIDKCDFYFQSDRSKDGGKAGAYYRLSGMFANHATFNEFKGVYGDLTPGKMTSSLLQASDMYHPQLKEFEGGPLPTVIPVGMDQDPHIRLARDMAGRIPAYEFIPISASYHTFLPGLKGGKMSSSDENSYIALSDTPKEAARKIKKYAFSGGQETLEEHRKKGGNPAIDVSFQMLRYGLEPDDKKLKKIEDDYRSGKMLTGELKQILIDNITGFLQEHQTAREEARKKIKDLDL